MFFGNLEEKILIYMIFYLVNGNIEIFIVNVRKVYKILKICFI